MYIDRNYIDEYSFSGVFYTTDDNMPPDGDMLGSETDMENAEKHVIQEVVCDIQATNKLVASGSGSFLDVFFPFDANEGVKVRIGHRFTSTDWYRPIDGKVTTVVPSPMGGCVVQIHEIGIDG